MLRPSLALLLMSTPALAQVPRVVVDMPINHSLASIVMGDLGSPELLLDRGGDPHHAQLRPSQARAVATADLVIWTGEALSPWMHDVVQTLAAGRVLELAEVEGLVTQPFADGTQFAEGEGDDHEGHDHGHDDHGHDDHAHDDHGHEGHAHDDHDHGHAHDGTDPHLWMNTANAALWLAAIAAELGEIDPANAETYLANATTGAGQIALLGAELASILQPAQGAGLVMHHDAYGYMAAQFGLTVLGTLADGDAADPGAARLSALRETLAQAGAVCIFPEVNHSDAFVRVVTEGTDLRIGAPLDPAGVNGEPGPDLYAQTMRQMAQAIAACVQGS